MKETKKGFFIALGVLLAVIAVGFVSKALMK